MSILKMNKNSVQFNMDFISEVEKYPQLYDNKLPDYSDRRATESIWAKIGEKFNETGPDCKSKWKSIRSAYIRSLNTLSKNQTKREYYLADNLQFLNPFTKSKSQSSFVEASADSDLEESENEDRLLRKIKTPPDSSGPASPASTHSSTAQFPQNRKKHMNLDIDYFTLKRKKLDSNPRDAIKDPCEMFLLSLVPHMASMTQRQQLTFQRGALELIDNIKYGQPESHS